ncbi:MAG: helix-turn-helix domain-containing protein [Dehalococcoidia bacterium]
MTHRTIDCAPSRPGANHPALKYGGSPEVAGGTLTVSVEEAARMLGIGRSLAYEAVRTGTFPTRVIKIGTRYVIPRAPLEALLRGEVAA